MQRIKPDVDIILDVLQAVLLAKPGIPFVESLLVQYQERGGLSKKQLQGLHSKASKISTIPASKLATLEAIIKKKHTKERSALPATVPLYEKDESTGQMIASILAKYPQHKRVLFFIILLLLLLLEQWTPVIFRLVIRWRNNTGSVFQSRNFAR